jgi:hypothetical protein
MGKVIAIGDDFVWDEFHVSGNSADAATLVNGGVKTGHRGGAKVGQFGVLWSTDFWQ